MSLLHFGTLALLVALTVPMFKGATSSAHRVGDIVLGLITLLSCVYLLTGENAFYDRGQA